MRLSEPTTKIWMKIDPYYQRQKCRPLGLVSGNIKFVRIFAGVLWRGGVKRQWGNRKRRFSWLLAATSSAPLEMRPRSCGIWPQPWPRTLLASLTSLLPGRLNLSRVLSLSTGRKFTWRTTVITKRMGWTELNWTRFVQVGNWTELDVKFSSDHFGSVA